MSASTPAEGEQGAALPLPTPFAASADAQPPQPWHEALDGASSLLSPISSAAYGRSVSFTAKGSLLAHAGGGAAEEAATSGSSAVVGEARNLCRLALPLSVANLTGYLIGTIALGIAGRLGQFELSAIILGTSIFNVTGLSLLMGFASAMETFCGQAVGAGNFRMVGIVFQRAILLTTIVAVVVAMVWTQVESILLVFRQDPLLSRAAARYIQMSIPALWCTGMYEVGKRYLMAQGIVRPASAVTLVGLALVPLYCWLFIFKLGLGLDGAAIAVDATQASMAALLGAYIMVRDGHQRGQAYATWHGWSMEALEGWVTYMRFALPSVVMVCVEWWTFEALIIMSGLLPDPGLTVAVMGICIQSSGLIWMFVSGFSMATSTRVSNSLGAGRPKAARLVTWTGGAIGVGLELAFMAAVVLLRHHWAFLFTDAQPVIDLTASLLPVFALSLPGDGANIVLQGLLRGSGRQETGAITNLMSYWILGIPLAAYLAFKQQLGLYGLWWGIVITNCFQGTVMVVIALRFNYRLEAAKAVARSQAHHPPAGAPGSDAGGDGGGDSSALREPLLGERLEQGLLAPSADA